MKRLLSTLFVTAGACALAAHPGHGNENPLNPGHYIGNPEHALPLALSVAVASVLIVWGVVRVNRYLSKDQARK